MQKCFALALFSCALLGAQTTGAPPLEVVQRLFSAMAAHHASDAHSLFLPGAQLFSIGSDGSAKALAFEQWLKQWPASKDQWEERITHPKVLEHGTVAVVWAEYTFRLNGTVHHCGIDSFQLLRDAGGWKISSISDTHETRNCS